MYYESRSYQLVEMPGALAAARYIKQKSADYEAIAWPSPDGKLIAVPDGHIDCPKLEFAILHQSATETRQIESITQGWIDSVDELAQYFVKCEHPEGRSNMGAAHLIVGQPTGTESAGHTCGCCGDYFTGNVKYQRQFDQDAGVGICKRCEKYYK